MYDNLNYTSMIKKIINKIRIIVIMSEISDITTLFLNTHVSTFL